MASVLRSPPGCGEVPPGVRELLVRLREARAASRGVFHVRVGLRVVAWGVCLLPGSARKSKSPSATRVAPYRPGAPRWTPRAVPDALRPLRGGPGRDWAPGWPAGGPGRPRIRSVPLTLALVVGRHLVAAFMSFPPSRAAGRWGRDGMRLRCRPESSRRPAALSGSSRSRPGLGASSVLRRLYPHGHGG